VHEKYANQQAIAQVPTIHPAIFADDCNGTFNYVITGNRVGYLAAYRSFAAHSGLHGILLLTPSTSPAPLDYCCIHKQLPLPATMRLTLQLFWAYGQPIDSRFGVTLNAYLPNNVRYGAHLRFRHSTGRVESYNPDLTTFNLPDLSFCTTPLYWNHVLLAISIDPPLFTFIASNNTLLYPTDLPLLKDTHSELPHLEMVLLIETLTTSSQGARIDHVLLTADNP